ncbi:MAG: M42 family metallopeptidase [Anaerolineae bacterium]
MMFEFLEKLCNVPAPGGYERNVHQLLLERWQTQVAEAEITPVGNYIAHVGGTGQKLLLVGHGDEIGFTVKYISPEGFIFFNSGQRNSDQPDLRGSYFNPMGQPALVVGHGVQLEGVFATLTGHILSPEQRQKTRLDWNDLFVDVFLPSREAVEAKGIKVGDRIVWNPGFYRRGDFLTGKAMDNRVSLALMDALLNQLEPDRLAVDLYISSTIQEESGLYGAQSINRQVNAPYAIAIDTGLSGDVPGVDPRNVATKLGAGPIIIHKDLYSYDVPLTHHIIDVATDQNIAIQHAAYSIYGTDAGALIREGVASSALAVPTRYTHSPFETIHVADFEATLALLLALVYQPLHLNN